jgi:hypothetical protein
MPSTKSDDPTASTPAVAGTGSISNRIASSLFHSGLIGYSHGGGMASNVAKHLQNDALTPWDTSIVYGATIDSVAYGNTADDLANNLGQYVLVPDPLSPTYWWGGSSLNSFNYYESTGYLIASLLPTGPLICGQVMPNASNFPFQRDNHSLIAVDQTVLLDVEMDTEGIYGALSN